MSASVSDLVHCVASAAGDGLVDGVGLHRIRQAQAQLPSMTGGISFEVHLGGGGRRTDFVVRALRRDRSALLEGSSAQLEPARRFAEAWVADMAGLEGIPYVDLEFDLDGSDRPCFVGAMIEPRLHQGMATVPAANAGSRWVDVTSSFEIACAVLHAAEASPVHPRIRKEVRRAFDALPSGGVIGHLGSLRCRQEDGGDLVRLIASLPRRDLVGYLDALSWPGSVPLLLEALERNLGPAARRVDLDLNFTRAGLGADTGFYRAIWSPGEEDVAAVVSALLRSGLATEAEASALSRFASRTGPPVEGLPWTMTFKTKLGPAGNRSAKVYLSLLAMG